MLFTPNSIHLKKLTKAEYRKAKAEFEAEYARIHSLKCTEPYDYDWACQLEDGIKYCDFMLGTANSEDERF